MGWVGGRAVQAVPGPCSRVLTTFRETLDKAPHDRERHFTKQRVRHHQISQSVSRGSLWGLGQGPFQGAGGGREGGGRDGKAGIGSRGRGAGVGAGREGRVQREPG